jgi:hypothetical protein
MIYEELHRKLKIEQHDHNYKPAIVLSVRLNYKPAIVLSVRLNYKPAIALSVRLKLTGYDYLFVSSSE